MKDRLTYEEIISTLKDMRTPVHSLMEFQKEIQGLQLLTRNYIEEQEILNQQRIEMSRLEMQDGNVDAEKLTTLTLIYQRMEADCHRRIADARTQATRLCRHREISTCLTHAHWAGKEIDAQGYRVADEHYIQSVTYDAIDRLGICPKRKIRSILDRYLQLLAVLYVFQAEGKMKLVDEWNTRRCERYIETPEALWAPLLLLTPEEQRAYLDSTILNIKK